MAVAHDAHIQSTTVFDNDSKTWTHTPVGTPRGVVVLIAQENGATDQVVGVTYGGVTMSRAPSPAGHQVKSTSEAGQVWIYFLGSGIPTGAQTVSVTMNPPLAADDWAGHSMTVTAAANTTINTQNGGIAALTANPSLSITPTAASVLYYVIWSGLNAPVATVSSGTHNFGNDFGTDSMMSSRKAVAAGATTMGYTATAADFAHAVVAVAEVVSGTTDVIPLGLAAGTAAAPAASGTSGQGVAVGTATGPRGAATTAQGVAVASPASPAAAASSALGLAVAASFSAAAAGSAGQGVAASVGVSASAAATLSAGVGAAVGVASSSLAASQSAGGSASALATGPSAAVPASLGVARASGAQRALQALIPFYIYPSFLGSEWDTVTADPASIGVIVANPASGPGVSSNSDYVTAIAAAQAAGLRVVGYVDTNYTARLTADVTADIDAWISFYDPDGIFLDRASSLLADTGYYQDLRDYVDVSMTAGKRTLVLNHGTSPDEAYASIGDILITFENDTSEYPAASFPSWMDAYPPERFSHILYNDPDWRASLALARARPVGFFFSTDDVLDNPWDSLPSEWSAQQAALSAPIGAPAGAASLAVGTAVTVGVAPSSASTAALGSAATAGVDPAVAANAASGLAAATGSTPGASGTAGTGVATSSGVASASASLATGVAVAVGFTPAASVSVTLSPGAATAIGVAPSSSAAAPVVIGLAALTGVSPGVTATAGLGTAAATGAALSAAATISTGIAVTVRFAPTDGTLDTTPLPGIAVGAGIAPGAAISAPLEVGQATATSAAPAASVASSPGVAASAGVSPAGASGATTGVATAAGLPAGVRVVVAQGLAAATGAAPASAGVAALGLAVGIGTTLGASMQALLGVGVATVAGFPVGSHIASGAVTAMFTPRTGATLTLQARAGAALTSARSGASVTLSRRTDDAVTITNPDGAALEVS